MAQQRKSRTQAFLERVGLVERDPRELVREWTRELRKEQRMLDRQVRQIEREEAKIKRDVKMLAKKGEREAMVPLAKALVQGRNARSRILVAKANINSVMLELRHQAAQLRMAEALQGSTKVMQAMNKLVRLPQLHGQMVDMAREMEKAGLIEEMMEDALDLDADLDDEVDDEVDKVISELTLDILSAAPAMPTRSPRELAESGKRLFAESMEEPRLAEGGGEMELDRRMAALQS